MLPLSSSLEFLFTLPVHFSSCFRSLLRPGDPLPSFSSSHCSIPASGHQTCCSSLCHLPRSAILMLIELPKNFLVLSSDFVPDHLFTCLCLFNSSESSCLCPSNCCSLAAAVKTALFLIKLNEAFILSFPYLQCFLSLQQEGNG